MENKMYKGTLVKGGGSGSGGGAAGVVALVAKGTQPSTPYVVGSKWFYNGLIYQATSTTTTDGGKTPDTEASYLFDGVYYYWNGSDLVADNQTNLVHITGTETITGDKTFSGKADFQGETTAVTQATSDSSQKVATTQFVKDYAQDGEWQKPADWVDIKSGAWDNSIYFLVAHSKPVLNNGVYTIASYKYFSLLIRVANSGNYDLFIDGIKIATISDNTIYEIDWEILYNNNTLKSGFDITHPSELTSHVIRITPTIDTDNFTRIQLRRPSPITSGSYQTGLLWCHFEINNAISLDSSFGNESDSSYRCYLLEAITAKDNNLKITNSYSAFRACNNLVKIPDLDFDGSSSPTLSGIFYAARKLTKIKLKNLIETGGMRSSFASCNDLQKVEFENCVVTPSNIAGVFSGCPALKELPDELYLANLTNAHKALVNLSKIQPLFLDFSLAVDLTTLGIEGSSSYQTNLVGLKVSDEAPFNYATAPQINVSYTNMKREALVALFNSMPTVSDSQEIDITGALGASDLTAEDIAIATGKGWTVTR